MIGQYLSNNNENATVAFYQKKIWHPNGAQVIPLLFIAGSGLFTCSMLSLGCD
jgi:hypothetical protein